MNCPYCNNEKTVKLGFRMTLKEGKKQRMQCMHCGKTFYAQKEA